MILRVRSSPDVIKGRRYQLLSCNILLPAATFSGCNSILQDQNKLTQSERFLDVSSKTDVDDLAARIDAENRARGPRFAHVDLIIFRYRDRDPKTAALIPVCGVKKLPSGKASKKDMELASYICEGKSNE